MKERGGQRRKQKETLGSIRCKEVQQLDQGTRALQRPPATRTPDKTFMWMRLRLTHGWGRCRDRWGWRVCCLWGRLSSSRGERREGSRCHAPAGTGPQPNHKISHTKSQSHWCVKVLSCPGHQRAEEASVIQKTFSDTSKGFCTCGTHLEPKPNTPQRDFLELQQNERNSVECP